MYLNRVDKKIKTKFLIYLNNDEKKKGDELPRQTNQERFQQRNQEIFEILIKKFQEIFHSKRRN